MTDTTAAVELRKPFDPTQIGKLPRITCGACRDNKQTKVCDRHTKTECNVCHNWITSAHMHLDYVGHAAVTSRLLEVDPNWNWEPPTAEELERLPKQAANGMWIALTINGVRRFGYGTSERADADSIKILIGDAIRNAAMRFGVALDLWSKEDLAPGSTESSGEQPATAPPAPPEPTGRDWLQETKHIAESDDPFEVRRIALLRLGEECEKLQEMTPALRKEIIAHGTKLRAQVEAAKQAAKPAKKAAPAAEATQ